MIEYKKILFCTDFSEDANIAFLHALDLAKKHQASLHILHIPHSSYSYMRHVVDEHIPEGAEGGEAFFDEKIMKRAEEALRKEYEKGFHSNRTIAAKNSEIAQAKFLEGKAQFKKENFEEAAHLFAMAIYFNRFVPKYHYFYGYALEKLGQLKDAVKALNSALDLKPSYSDVFAELGHVYLKLGFPLRAQGYFNKALELNHFHTRAKEGLIIIKKSKARKH